MDFPSSHWRNIRADNVRERANRGIKRRAKVVQSFPSRGSPVRLVGAVLIGGEDARPRRRMFSREVTAEAWDERRRPVPAELELKTAERRAADVVAEALDQAGGPSLEGRPGCTAGAGPDSYTTVSRAILLPRRRAI